VPLCSSYLRVSAVHFCLSDCQDVLATRKCQTKFRMSIAGIARSCHTNPAPTKSFRDVTTKRARCTQFSRYAYHDAAMDPTLTANKASRRKRPVLLRFCLSESQHFLAHSSQKRRPTDRYSSCNVKSLSPTLRKCTYNRTASAMAKVKWRC
jgi:hypothetical protein